MHARQIAALARSRRTRVRGPDAWLSVADAERAARRRLPRPVFDFVSGGADEEITLRANAESRSDWALRPRVLSGATTPRLDRSILGEHHSVPFVLGPTGFTGVVHPEGELAVARAAQATGVTYTVSGAASNTDLRELVNVSPGSLWFNYYPLADERRGHALVDRARDHGCQVLVVTVDVPVAGHRERDIRSGFSIPPQVTGRTIWHGLRRPAWSAAFLRGPQLRTPNLGEVDVLASSSEFPKLFASDLDWSVVDRLRDRWPGKLVVKGILAPDDARLAASHGVEGVVVSNHGGRQLDGAPAALRALPAVVEALDSTGVEVLVDSGFRRGRDLVVALALGATAVLVGRPYLYGLAGAGQQGVERVIELLREELTRSLHLLGVSSVADLDRSMLDSPLIANVPGPSRRDQ